MKISNEVISTVRQNDTASTSKAGPAAAAKASAPAAAVDSVKISDAGRALQTSSVGNAEAPFDAQRVDAIKAAISAGTFKVNPDAVAGKLLDSVNQLLTDKA